MRDKVATMGTLVFLLAIVLPLPVWASAEELFSQLNKLSSTERQQRLIEGAKRKKFVIQSPITFDPAQEEQFDRLYIGTLVKKGT